MFDAARTRLAKARSMSSMLAPACVRPLRALVIEDARTKRGNVPLYVGPLSDVAIPITVVASHDALTIRSVDWAMRKMVAKDSPRGWATVVADVAHAMWESR